MTLQECTAQLATLALALRADVDDPTFRAYHRVLKDTPAQLLEVAIDDLSRTGVRFLPAATELLAACETARRRLLALNPYDGCAECEDQRGYRTVLNAAGQKTVERCPCKGRHLEKLARMGLSAPLASLPGEVARESEQVYPSADQLPAPVRDRLVQISGQRLMR
jgi:hypothetical protein